MRNHKLHGQIVKNEYIENIKLAQDISPESSGLPH